MASFEPFRALRYAAAIELQRVVAPPYDVLSTADVDQLAVRDLHSIVHVDVPLGGEQRYLVAGKVLRQWIRRGVLAADPQPSFTICRMRWADETGKGRHLVGVLGALEVTASRAGAVLPHEHTTVRACADRLELLRQTRANTSPVWGLSLAGGLADLLGAPGEAMGKLTVGAVEHVVERITDPARLAAIAACVGAADVLIADGHHRYQAARQYRDNILASACARCSPPAVPQLAEHTLAFVSELSQHGFVVNPIHHLYRRECLPHLQAHLERFFEIKPASIPDSQLIAEMVARGRLALLDAQGRGSWLIPRPKAFDQVRDLDAARLQLVEQGCTAKLVTCQQGLGQVRQALADGGAEAVILTRPASLCEIKRSGCGGPLMPPWSTSFAPKPLTGVAIRDLAGV